MKIMIINIEDRAYAEIKEDTEKFRSNGMVIPYLYKVIESGIPISIQSIGAPQPKTGQWTDDFICSNCGKIMKEGEKWVNLAEELIPIMDEEEGD